MPNPLSDSQRHFIDGVLRRRRLFLPMMAVGVVVGLGLLGHAIWIGQIHPEEPIALRVVLAIMILLNARQQLRQHRYAGVLSALMEDEGTDQSSSSDAIAS